LELRYCREVSFFNISWNICPHPVFHVGRHLIAHTKVVESASCTATTKKTIAKLCEKQVSARPKDTILKSKMKKEEKKNPQGLVLISNKC
jgi:hypothetical protein